MLGQNACVTSRGPRQALQRAPQWLLSTWQQCSFQALHVWHPAIAAVSNGTRTEPKWDVHMWAPSQHSTRLTAAHGALK